ncbi:DNA-binding GntR family transcriptional regulator [Tamaricihabitans halophyticus]|uniref:DNA-binding GntR family transcriptional regulator n=1 Tax=Tamaricihabitans halophyticus TaxID=1262583 RepID=A0A4V2ST88_9PSEU|nr:GntR family transcriptional regulator [Tamaricihabitans halophyticus]TCP49946.1 DNA-binding GntR family transcriptional regulator [Tamaricihabitans halophyticus]
MGTRENAGEGGGTRKYETIRQQLRARILSGSYEPGDPIPERAIAEELDVSRVPVREALRQLERDGLVSIIAQRGAYVRQFSAENMQSLYQAREALEGMAARLTAERVDETYLADFVVSFQGLVDGSITMDPAEASELGNDFHNAIAKGSRNATVIELLSTIHDQVRLCRRLAYGHASPAWARKAAEEHLAIAAAISNGDPDLAERTMRAHVSTWAGFLRSRLAGDSPRPYPNTAS